MLSISPAKSAGSAMVYFSDHLVEDGQAANPNEDYYQKGSESPGQWHGGGAEALGLTGDVSAEDMARCLLGIDHQNNKLVQNGGNPERRAGWDLTFSAPKSVSTVWGLADGELREQIADAHHVAVKTALQKLESEYLFSRRGHGGEELENAKLVAATFDHGTSREQDPQLHTHSFLMNLAQRADGSWGTLQSAEFFQAKMLLGALYRAELASQLQSNCGFNIERDGRSFRLAGMSPELEKQFSKRREEIEKKLDEKGGRSAKAAEVAALDTRSKKNAISTDELRQSWQDQASELGHDLESIQRDLAEAQPEPLQMPTPESLLAELTEQASTVSKYQLQAAVYTHAQGVLNAEQAEQYLDELLHHDELMTLRDHDGRPRYTTHEMYNLEKNLAESAERRSQETHHQASQEAIDQALANRPTMTDEQKYMLSHITGPEGFAAVQGVAGAGKSFTLGAAREVWEADGKEVIGCALAGKAADGLEEGSGIFSQTIHSLINDLDKGYKTLSKNSVLVIDEAGMINSRLMADITGRANESGSKIIVVGDANQLQPINSGGAFRLLTKTTGAVLISDIRRQKEDWAKQAVRDFASGEAGKALQAHVERGLVHVEKDHDELLEKMVANHIAERDPKRPGENLMIAATRREVAYLNQLTRSELQAAGEVKEDSARVNGKFFAEGDRILFTKNNRQVDVKNGVLGTVISASENQFDVITDAGKRVSFNPAKFEHFQHGYAITCHKAQSVTVQNAHVLINQGMSDRHWSYVAASRARERTQFYATSDTWEEAAKTMSRQNLKDTTQDYEIGEQSKYQEKEKDMGIVLSSEEERAVERYRKELEGNTKAVQAAFDREQKKIQETEEDTLKKLEQAAKHGVGRGHRSSAETETEMEAPDLAQDAAEDLTEYSIEAPGSERLEANSWADLFEGAEISEADNHTRIELEDGGIILDYDYQLVSRGVDPETMAEAAAEKFQDIDGPIEITSNDPDTVRGHEWCIGVIGEMIENHDFEREDFDLEEMGISHEELDFRGIGVKGKNFDKDLDNDGLADEREDDRGLKHDDHNGLAHEGSGHEFEPSAEPGEIETSSESGSEHQPAEMMSEPGVESGSVETASSEPVQSQPEMELE